MCFIFALFICALVLLTAASPQPAGRRNGTTISITKRYQSEKDGKIDVVALDVHTAWVRAKIARGFENYERNVGEIPYASMSQQVEKRSFSNIGLTNYASFLWYGSIFVGNPPKLFYVVMDTGSSDFFLPANACDQSCSGHNLWNPRSSITSRYVGQPCNLIYNDGSTVSGNLYTDVAFLAKFTATAQLLCAADLYSSQLSRSEFTADGLIGLGFQSLSRYGGIPIFQTLVSQGQITNPVFSFAFLDLGGELYLGGVNAALYTGSFTYVDVWHPLIYWIVKMDNIQVNGLTIGIDGAGALIDTGSTALLGPSDYVAVLNGLFGGTPLSTPQGYYAYPCDHAPSVSVSFGGTSFPISPKTFSLGKTALGNCVSGIGTANLGDNFWIIGQVFLRNVYTTFDVGNLQVGFARLRPSASTSGG